MSQNCEATKTNDLTVIRSLML